MAAEVKSFTDEEVMQPPDRGQGQAPQRGFSDADVMAPPTAPRGFTDEEVMQPAAPPGSANPGVIGRVWNAFRGAAAYPSETMRGYEEGFKEGFGEKPLGWPEQTIPFLQKWGLARKGDETGPLAVARAADEVIFYRGAQAFDLAMRSPGAVWRGLQGGAYAALTGAGTSTQFARDIVSLPDAFMGSPHPPDVPPRVARVLSQTEVREAIDQGPIDRGRHIPYEAGASKTSNTTYVDSSLPTVATLPSGKTFNPDIPAKIHEQVEVHVMEKLIAGGMDKDTAYKVAHWEWAEVAENAWYKAQGIDVAEAEGWWKERSPTIQHEPSANTPPDLYDKPYPHDSISAAQTEGSTATPRPTEEEIERANRIMDAGGIAAFHGTPHGFERFDISKIGTGEGAQSYGHGLYFAESKGVAQFYRKSLSGGEIPQAAFDDPEIGPRLKAANAEWDNLREEHGNALDAKYEHPSPANDARVLELKAKIDEQEKVLDAVEREAKDKYKDQSGSLYRVRINADPEQFLDYDKPLRDQTQHVRDALRNAFGDQITSPEFFDKSETHAGDWLDGMETYFGDKAKVSRRMNEAGIPGIKYYDASSRGTSAREIAEEALARHNGNRREAAADLHGEAQSPLATPETKAAWDALRSGADLEATLGPMRERTSNYVVFDDKLIDITHRNGERLGNPLDLAKELGVIGPKPPLLSDSPPAEAAKAAVPPKGPGGGPPPLGPDGKPPPEEPSEWRLRFNHFLDKFQTTDDAKALIQNAVDRNNEFPEARAGNIPLKQVELLGEATGIDPANINRAGTGRLLRNDDQVRNALQAMQELNERLKLAAEQVAAKGGKDDLAELTALQTLRMQHNIMTDSIVEQVVGLRAEWGRTGNAIQEFLEAAKEGSTFGKYLKDKKAESLDDLRDMGKMIAATDKASVAPVIAKMRNARPGFVYWGWQQGLISGMITHSGYAGANALYAVQERGVITPLAAMVGRARQVFGIGPVDKVLFGETAAGLWGSIASVPTSIMGAMKSVYAGMPVALKSDVALQQLAIARGEKPPPAVAKAIQRSEIPSLKPEVPWYLNYVIGPKALKVLGLPGDAAGGLHTAFRINAEQASWNAVAYRKAMTEAAPGTDGFWQRFAYWRANMTPEMLEEANADAYRGTFMSELGPKGKAWGQFVQKIPGLKWLFPFNHIPLDILKKTYEQTPLAFLDSEMRASLTGQRGGVAQDKAIARVMFGSSVMGYFFHKAMIGQATGELPPDQQTRDSWKMLNKQPNSILIGDRWLDLRRFGQAGGLAALGANFADVVMNIPDYGQGWGNKENDSMTKAVWLGALAAGHFAADAPGFQSLHNLFEAMQSEKKGEEWAAQTATSFVPFSSFVGQTASGGIPLIAPGLGDMYMREAKTFTDELKYKFMGLREQLLPKRDVFGQPVVNPQYGNIYRQTQAVTDPIRLELDRLKVYPSLQDRIGNVKLTPELYDEYQARAGDLTHMYLDALMRQPAYQYMPDAYRHAAIDGQIKTAHEQAAYAMQMFHHEIPMAGLRQRLDYLTGTSPTPRPKKPPPELTQPESRFENAR